MGRKLAAADTTEGSACTPEDTTSVGRGLVADASAGKDTTEGTGRRLVISDASEDSVKLRRMLAAAEDTVGVELWIAIADGMEDAVGTGKELITADTMEGMLVMAGTVKGPVEVGRELTAAGDSVELRCRPGADSIRLKTEMAVAGVAEDTVSMTGRWVTKDPDGELLVGNVTEVSARMESACNVAVVANTSGSTISV